MRAFVAVDLDPGIKTALEALVRRLKACHADVRWADAGGMHLTLKFLGWIDESQVARIEGLLSDVARRHAAFPLRLEGTGAFPADRDPRVLWAGVAAEPGLLALQEDLDAALEADGFEREKRAFTPHLTLGRVKGPDGLARAMAELDKHRGDVFGAMTVRKLVLIESLLRPEGAEYRIAYEAGLT
jgi:2'-5' RNA ligase